MRAFCTILLFAVLCPGAEYSGPRPPKADIPYLLHAGKLVETEAVEAREQQKKDDVTYIIDGAGSTVKTPISEPVFLIEAAKLDPRRFELYKMDVKNGHREITINQKRKKGPRPIHIEVTLVAEKLYRIEVSQSLENGDYSLSPSDSNTAFCFQVY